MRLRERLQTSLHRRWIGWFLRAIAVLYLFGALVHYGNLLGLGEKPWAQMPLSWRLGDLFYAPLDTTAVVGCWSRTVWGVACFLVAALSQLVLYVGFPELFAFTEAQRQALNSMAAFHAASLMVFFLLLYLKR